MSKYGKEALDALFHSRITTIHKGMGVGVEIGVQVEGNIRVSSIEKFIAIEKGGEADSGEQYVLS